MSVVLATGGAKEQLRQLPDGCAHACVTSPPYFGLRQYGGDGEIGLEQTPSDYIERLVRVFRETRRVLRDDGSCWIVIGDSYNNFRSQMGPGQAVHGREDLRGKPEPLSRKRGVKGLKEKDLIGIPWLLAFALRADGWYLREELPWLKPSCMPECLDEETKIFVKKDKWVSRITLRELAELGKPYPEILGPQGWVAIKNLWRTVKPALRMEAAKVETVVCSPDHLFPISSDRRREAVHEQRAEDIRHTGYADYLLYRTIDSFLQPVVENWHGQKLGKEIGYLIGVYAAEGGYDGDGRGWAVRFTIGTHEPDFLEHLKRACATLSLPFRVSVEDSATYFVIHSEWFRRTVDSFIAGNVRTKALNIELILNAPRDFREGLLAGYVEGDGSERRGGGWIATSASRRLRDDMATLASSVGLITSKGFSTRTDKRTGNTSTAWSLWTPYQTKRKSKSGMEGVYQVPPRRRTKLNENRNMIDLEVEGHLFLIGDGLITHNSVKDRCTRQHETIFRLTKSPQCYFDWYAIAENAQADRPSGNGFKRDARLSYKDKNGARGNDEQWTDVGGMRNARSVWQINPEPFDSQMCLGCGTYFRGADYKSLERDPDSRRICTCGAADRWLSHFAVFPTRLASRAIRATTPDGGCCGRCGAPFRRVLSEREADPEWLKACGADSSGGYAGASRDGAAEAGAQDASATKARILAGMRRRETAGWSRTCSCTDAAGIMPALVIDPFSGAGTTALCANRLGRDAYGIDLKEDYNRMALHRLNDERAKCLDGDGSRLPFVPCEVYPA